MKKQTYKQLKDRLDVLEALCSKAILDPLKSELARARTNEGCVLAELEKETDKRVHWEKCAGRLMLENQHLKNGRSCQPDGSFYTPPEQAAAHSLPGWNDFIKGK